MAREFKGVQLREREKCCRREGLRGSEELAGKLGRKLENCSAGQKREERGVDSNPLEENTRRLRPDRNIYSVHAFKSAFSCSLPFGTIGLIKGQRDEWKTTDNSGGGSVSHILEPGPCETRFL
ncbi:hypothetical protein RUM44_010633 [Polyplax serrata]|uniref:Uncharacterized protein n=1 Tax=Polyplax serrata TaxID=468196 RepID=A0ABR1ANG6_POLSC